MGYPFKQLNHTAKRKRTYKMFNASSSCLIGFLPCSR
ncbi:hypothetical protein [Bacillus phage BSTP8]|nr:hypothetical protein BSTP5_013 [Bacillus phage BSTP5]QRI44363.1 hypothetical protein [Bacillus phage BSTP8]QRI44404.1 hypothetical protein [Bacillus phage BSTP10]QRI44534.1 hypothetical protein [Bacillus phage BSTP12]